MNNDMILDRSREAQPLYIQIKNWLKDKIEKGEYLPGDMLPTEPEMCKAFNVSRITVREAILELVKEDYVVRERGRGSFVTARSESQLKFYTEIKNFTYEMREQGFEPITLYAEIELVVPEKGIRDFFNMGTDEKIYRLVRTRGTSNKPIVLFKTYLSGKLRLSEDSRDYYGSLYSMISKECNISIQRIDEKLDAVLPDEDIAETLHISPKSPVLKRIRNSYWGDMPIEYTEGYYIGGMYQYCLHFNQ